MAVIQLGRPIQAVCFAAAAYGTASEGEALIYAVSSGKPCKLFVIRVSDGTCLHSSNLEGSSHTWGVTVTPDGTVYMGGDGLLYRWRAGMEQVECIGAPIEGETYFWRLDHDARGRVYGGTYPNGKVFRYDPETETFLDYGQMVDGEQYTRSLSVGKSGQEAGKFYAGIGTKLAHLVEVDIESGRKRRVELPDTHRDERMVYDLNAFDGRLYARSTPSGDLLVYDLGEARWTDCIPGVLGLDVSPPDRNGGVYLIKDDRLHRYDPAEARLTATEMELDQHARSFGWVRAHDPRLPGDSLVSMQAEGRYWLYNPQTERHMWMETNLDGPPVSIQSLTRGPDGHIYAGGYFAGGLARYAAADGSLASFQGLGQSEGIVSHEGALYMGVYPKARIYRYEPGKPWEMGQNPALAFALREQKQDRPFAMLSAGKELAVGTVPDYGQLGGALTLYDTCTGEVETYRDIVEAQSVISLAYRDGIVFGGTSVWGGLGIEPKESEARLFLWDQASRRKLWEGVPVAGEKAISSLAVDPTGMLWGLTAATLFQFDPQTWRVTQVKELYPYDWSAVKHYWRGGCIRVAEDGMLYGNALRKLFTYDPARDTLTVLNEDASLFAEDEAGNWYFTRKDLLFQYNRA